MPRNFVIRTLVLIVAALLILVGGARAQVANTDGIWTNTSGGNWSSSGNWFNGEVEYGDDRIADFSTLNITSDVTVNNDISSYSQLVGHMIFGDTDSTNNWNVTGNGLYLVAFYGTPTITVLNKTTTISAALGGDHGLAVNGPGTLALTGTNIFLGGLTINSGKVQVPTVNNFKTNGPLGNIGNNGDVLVLGSNGNTAGLEYTGTSNTSSNMPITIPTGATGSINVDGGFFNTSTTLTISGAVSARGTFQKDGIGVLVLSSNSNFFLNGIVIGGGTLEAGSSLALNAQGGDNSVSFTQGNTGSLNLNGFSQTIGTLSTAALPGNPVVQNANSTAATLTINETSNSTFAGTLQDGSGGGALSVTKTGANTLTLTKTNSFTGALKIQQGTISVPTFNNASTNGPLGNQSSVTLGSSNQTGTIEYTGATASSSMPLNLAATGTGAIQVDTASTNLSLSGVVSGTGAFNKTGSGTVTLTNTNTFTGALAIKQGALSVPTINSPSTTGPLGSHTNITLGDSGTTGTLEYTGASASTNMPFVLATGGTGAIQVDNAATNLTLATSPSGSGTFAKSGPGTLTLSSSFTGALNIAQGTLVTASTDTLTTYSSITLGSNGQTGTLQYTGGKGSPPSASIVLPTGGTGVFLNNAALGSPTFAGVISGGGGLVKSGTSGMTLSGTNTFTGGLTIQAGTLSVGTFNNANTDGPLGHNSSITIAGGANLTYNGGTASSSMPIVLTGGAANITVTAAASPLTLGGTISGNGSLTKSSFGAITLAGSNSYSGGTTISQGAINAASPTALGTGPLTMSASTTLNIAGGVTVSTPAGFTLPSGAQINASAGSFSTGGTGTNHGTYTIAAGTLFFNASSGSTTNASDGKINAVSSTLNLGTGANNLLNSGRINLIDTTVNGDIQSDATGVINTAGNVTFNGNITGPGAMTISDGVTSLAPSANLSVVVNSFSNTGTLNLSNNNMIVNYSGSSPAASIQSELASGYNSGSWSGTGITSSTAAGDTNFRTGVGYAEASQLGLANGGTFDGHSIPGQAVLVKYTYYGDSDLDGKVTLNDFSIFVDGFNGLGSGWVYGDYDYNGSIDLNDFAMFVDDYKNQGSQLSSLNAAILSDPSLSVVQKNAMLSVVPEPTSLAMILPAAVLLRRRKR